MTFSDCEPGTSKPPDDSTPWALPENGRAISSSTIHAATNHRRRLTAAPLTVAISDSMPTCIIYDGSSRGRSSMVEPEPSKLQTGVRLPSPAPDPRPLRRVAALEEARDRSRRARHDQHRPQLERHVH